MIVTDFIFSKFFFLYSRQNPFNLLIALNYTGQASGNLFLDDGEELNSIDNGHYTMLQFIAQEVSFVFIIVSYKSVREMSHLLYLIMDILKLMMLL